jgi:hypothetical protein
MGPLFLRWEGYIGGARGASRAHGVATRIVKESEAPVRNSRKWILRFC